MFKKLVLGFLTFFIFAMAVNAETIHVNQPQSIQAAIDAASGSDTILVADGEYFVSNLDFMGKAITVKSENGPEKCILQAEGRWARVFYFHSGERKKSVVRGFTITGGTADYGAGISCKFSSSPTIENNVITGNIAGVAGGGVYCFESSPTIQNNTISNNSAGTFGGGIACFANSSPALKKNIITNNNSGVVGGAIYCNASPLKIQGGEIVGNTAGREGEGIYASDSKVTGAALVLDEVASDDEGLAFVDFTLPVTLAWVTCSIRADGVHLGWRTESETNSFGFDLYRNNKKINSKIIPSKGPGEYRYVAKDIFSGIFELKEVDIFGNEVLVKTVSARKLKPKTWCQIKKI